MSKNSYFICLLKRSRSIAVGVVTGLRPSLRRNCVSIYSSTEPSDKLWGQPMVIVMGTGDSSTVISGRVVKVIIHLTFLCPVARASLYNLVNETNLVHHLFLVYFVNFIYNLYMSRTASCPSSGGTTVFM